jgi:UDP-glucose 4-epimerase
METREIKYRVYNIGSGSGLSLNQLIEIMKKITGKEISVKYSTGRKIDVPINILDISLARAILEWRPEVPIEEGVGKTLEYVKVSQEFEPVPYFIGAQNAQKGNGIYQVKNKM